MFTLLKKLNFSFRFLFCLLFLCLFISCDYGNNSKSANNSNSTYTIKGKILNKDYTPAPDVNIYIQDSLKTVTDTDGTYTITDLSQGSYTLTAKKALEDGSETMISYDFNCADLVDMIINSLLLPEPVKMLPPLEILTNSITVTWGKYNGSDFREYKVYANNLPNIDENNGTLIYVETDSNINTYLFKGGYGMLTGMMGVSPGVTYYFRIYVMNSKGLLAGSNIISVTTRQWDNEAHFSRFYALKAVQNFAGTDEIRGITYDGNYLWLMYFNNNVTIVQYDYTNGTVLKSFAITDSNKSPNGLAWDGQYLWMSCYEKIKKIDPVSGEVVKTFTVTYGVTDLSSDGTNLYLNRYYPDVDAISPLNGGIVKEYGNPFSKLPNCYTGIAYHNGELWFSCRQSQYLAILDTESGEHIGIVDAGLKKYYYLCFMNNQLVCVDEGSQVYIFDIETVK